MNADACGAYGREANIEDWKAGKDFRFLNGPYFSIRDTQLMIDKGYTSITFYTRCDTFVVDLVRN